ncbi:hypothetical protein L596_005952 [Steinernema carpocapsae]|uniref:MADF domain-containing protein n=1 Tax=Steinernema carpocapsae TaxID=34508 RepID=A0A4U8V5J9_STECR|nr:hypothetical protein L596_005952 [Steinernema carpocapsae]
MSRYPYADEMVDAIKRRPTLRKLSFSNSQADVIKREEEWEAVSEELKAVHDEADAHYFEVDELKKFRLVLKSTFVKHRGIPHYFGRQIVKMWDFNTHGDVVRALHSLHLRNDIDHCRVTHRKIGRTEGESTLNNPIKKRERPSSGLRQAWASSSELHHHSTSSHVPGHPSPPPTTPEPLSPHPLLPPLSIPFSLFTAPKTSTAAPVAIAAQPHSQPSITLQPQLQVFITQQRLFQAYIASQAQLKAFAVPQTILQTPQVLFTFLVNSFLRFHALHLTSFAFQAACPIVFGQGLLPTFGPNLPPVPPQVIPNRLAAMRSQQFGGAGSSAIMPPTSSVSNGSI